MGVENFIPTRIGYHERRGKRYKAEKPVINNLVFLRDTKPHACAIANGIIPVFYMIDQSTRSLLVVPDKQMEDFRKVMDLNPDSIMEEQMNLLPGNRVRVIKGPMTGVEGDILELEAHTYVVLSLAGFLQAKVEIPMAYLEKI